MIDAASYLNSADIAAHWRKIGYSERCTPLQSAYIVRRCCAKTLAEKHAAWREIAETTPDCPVATGDRRERMGISDALADSLHEFLRAYMALENTLIERFYKKGDHAVYRFCVLYDGDGDWSRESLLFDTAEACFEAVNADEDLLPAVRGIQIVKQWIGENRAITLWVRTDKTVLRVDADGMEEAEEDLLQAFEWMWFDFPTPFRKGDIVVSEYSPFGCNLYADEPFVLTGLCSWGSRELALNGYPDKDGLYADADRSLRRHREGGDESDMTAHGHFQTEDGGVYFECMHRYLDLEYYRKKPVGIRRILKAFSSFEKEEIGSDLLAIAYHVLMEEEKVKRDRERLSCFTDEGLLLAGLKEDGEGKSV